MFQKCESLKYILIVLLIYTFFYALIFHLAPSSDFVPVVVNKSERINQENLIKSIVKCNDKAFESERTQNGEYWIFTNYIRAGHGPLNCGQTITYTTHGDYTYLENLEVLVPRWKAPVSFAIYASGHDFEKALKSIQYIRNCLTESKLIRYYVTFHLYFHQNHTPYDLEEAILNSSYDCSPKSPPYKNVKQNSTYKEKRKLFYPINVGRNIARKAALTHFILASDVELYPNLGFVDEFLQMIIRNPSVLIGDKPRVFPIATFEIKENAKLPDTKTQLQKLLSKKIAIPFHEKVCDLCHNIPKMYNWVQTNETNELKIFTIAKRHWLNVLWEPFYVSDNHEPYFDERFTWESKRNKRIQAYAMCLLDYEYHVLNNAFLIHKPGIKVYKDDPVRIEESENMNERLTNKIIPEYTKMYGFRKKCKP